MVVFEVPFPSTLELSEFMRGVVGVFGVHSFRDFFVLDFCGLRPSGVTGLRALDHSARLGSGILIFSAFTVIVRVVVSFVRVFSVVFRRVTPGGVSAAGRR